MIERLREATGRGVSRETLANLEHYAALLINEADQQNLIAKSTVDDLWERHIVDSAQLLRFLPQGRIADVGSGAGLPGIVLAILSSQPITLIEPRRLRVDFLNHCITELGLPHATVAHAKAERVEGRFDGITARAVANIDQIFRSTLHLSHPGTTWVLPKGQKGQLELAAAKGSWQGHFRTEPSITEGDAVIVVASGLSAKRKGRG